MSYNWPEGVERTPESERRPYPHNFQVTQTQAFRNILTELGRMDATDVKVQTAAKHREDNPAMPYKNAHPEDATVVVWCSAEGQDLVFPCDAWDSLRDNAQAIAKHIAAYRALDRYGVQTTQSKFAAQALPSGEEDDDAVAADPPWYETLQVAPEASKDVIQAAARQRMKQVHADTNQGETDMDAMMQIKRARAEALNQLAEADGGN